MKRILSCFLILILISFSFVGCSHSQSSENSSDFTMAYLGLDALNPILSQSNLDHSVLYLLEIQMIRLFNGEIVCDAAESYQANEDFTRYTFKIREGLTWSNGDTLDANDFLYGIYCLLAPEMGSPRASSWFSIKNAEAFANGESEWENVGVHVENDLTLVIELNRPVNDFDRTIALKHIYPIHESFVKQIGVEQLGASPEKLLCSGPYILTERNNADLILQKNTRYWNSANSFPTNSLRFIKVDDANTQVAMFENHEIDAIHYVPSHYNQYLSNYLYTVPGGGIELIWLNENPELSPNATIMQNKNFRLALTNGFNRKNVTTASNTAYTPYNRIIDTSFYASDGTPFVEKYPVSAVPLEGNIVKAKEYLDEALKELNINSVSELPQLTMVTFSDENYKNECEMLIDEWRKNLGIDCITLVQYEAGQAIDTFYKAAYDMFVISWEPNVRPTDIMVDLMTGGEGNPGTWSNKEFDELVNKAVGELDALQQAKFTQEAEQLFLDESSLIPVYILNTVSAVQKYVTGFQTGVIDGYEFDRLTVTRK